MSFLSQTEALGLTALLEWQIEIGGRFDVRMFASPRELACEAHAGDYLLSSAGLSGNLINGEPPPARVTVDPRADIQFAGWAADLKAGAVPQRVSVELASAAAKSYFALAERKDRPDVAAAFSNPALSDQGLPLPQQRRVCRPAFTRCASGRLKTRRHSSVSPTNAWRSDPSR